jgi:GT2 family glycosyltransferase
MIYYVTPYALDGNFFKAVDCEIMRAPNDNDWVAIMDGDACFLGGKWGHLIKEYVERFPDTGLFTSYASRCSYNCQLIAQGKYQNNLNIIQHAKIAKELSEKEISANIIERKIAGHIMIIKKSVWKKVRAKAKTKVQQKSKNILGVDTEISKAILQAGYPIRRMNTIYMFHYFRMLDGKKDHLL